MKDEPVSPGAKLMEVWYETQIVYLYLKCKFAFLYSIRLMRNTPWEHFQVTTCA